MIESLFHIFLGILGLGVLVFIHELGHYIIARREGMKVEAFSIGFGKPIYSWLHKGVRWQVGILPFGGFVRIAGMQKEGSKEPHEIVGGFFSKTPMQRIRVALAGPFVNIVFAMIVFCGLWVSGGQDRQFHEMTRRVGWVNPESDLYAQGLRPGDLIETANGQTSEGLKDVAVASLMSSGHVEIRGERFDPRTGSVAPLDLGLSFDASKERLIPASYLFSAGLVQDSPLNASGILPDDRLLWADGEILFSQPQLSAIINESSAFLTVQRGKELLHVKVPRVHLDEMKITPVQRAEFDDWQHEAGLKGKVQDLFFIPYLLSPQGWVEMRLDFLDERDQRAAALHCERCAYSQVLEEGDRILAVGNQPISSSYDLLHELQTRRVQLIVQRASDWKAVSAQEADRDFETQIEIQDLNAIIAGIGTKVSVQQSGDLILLKSVTPTLMTDPATRQRFEQARKSIEAIEEPIARSEALKNLEREESSLRLGIHLKDRPVLYNPNPLQQFTAVCKDVWRTLTSLFSGSVSPKHLSGPIGIVTVFQNSWALGFKEAMFWMALISLNLALVNLLPIPVLDGGHVLMAIIEGVTRRRLSPKLVERIVIPFVGLILAFLAYVTYHDFSRLFG